MVEYYVDNSVNRTGGFITIVKYPSRHIAECSVALNFPGIEKHKNPDGTLFEKEQMITPAILMKVSDSIRNNQQVFSEQALREIIDIKPIIPFDIKRKIKESELKKEAFVFFPNQFNLTIAMDINGHILSVKETHHILQSIIKEYRKDFEKRYGGGALFVAKFPDKFLINSDYPVIIQIFKSRVNAFISFLDFRIKKSGFFKSKYTYDSFIDIKKELEIIYKITIPTLEANIEILQLTKNKNNAINLYTHKIKLLNSERKKKEKEAQVAYDLLKYMRQPEKYQKSNNDHITSEETNLTIDSAFINNLIKQDSTSFLLKAVLKSETQARTIEVDIECFEKEIALLKGKKNRGAHEKEKTDYVKKDLIDIKNNIVALAERANNLNIEFSKNIISNAVQLYKDVEIRKVRDVNIKKNAVIACVVSLFLSIMLAFFIEYIKNNIKAARAEKPYEPKKLSRS